MQIGLPCYVFTDIIETKSKTAYLHTICTVGFVCVRKEVIANKYRLKIHDNIYTTFLATFAELSLLGASYAVGWTLVAILTGRLKFLVDEVDHPFLGMPACSYLHPIHTEYRPLRATGVGACSVHVVCCPGSSLVFSE